MPQTLIHIICQELTRLVQLLHRLAEENSVLHLAYALSLVLGQLPVALDAFPGQFSLET
jgi:hypothetical protein